MTASKRGPPTASADTFPRHQQCRLVLRFKEEIRAGPEHKCTSVSRTSSTRGATVLRCSTDSGSNHDALRRG